MGWAELAGVIAPAVLALCIVRVLLLLLPPPRAKLRDPAKVPGMPMAGPSSAASAHAAIMRGRSRPWWKFRS